MVQREGEYQFYALFFGEDSPSRRDHRRFADCFVNYETRIRLVTATDEEGSEVQVEESYTVAVPVEDLSEVWRRISEALGLDPTEAQQANAESIYNLIEYGYNGGMDGWVDGLDVPFIGADGFCLPVGSNWRNIVTSEFGYRKDPFTGKTKGHSGMDLAVPTGMPIRAALGGNSNDGVPIESEGYDYARYAAYVPGVRDILNAELERAADYIVGQDRRVSFEELEDRLGLTVREGNGLDTMLLGVLERRPEVAAIDFGDGGIGVACQPEFGGQAVGPMM